MDLLAAYADEDDETTQQPQHGPATPAAAASAAAAASSSKAPAAAAAAAASSSSSSRPPASAFPSSSLLSLEAAAPDVPLDLSSRQFFVNPAHNTLYYNPKVEELYTQLQGPLRPGQEKRLGATQGLTQNHQRGFVEPMHMSNFVFEDQYHSFINKGYDMRQTCVQRAV